MKPQHFLIFAIAIVTCALSDLQAGADELFLQDKGLIMADLEVANSTPLTVQDFSGGVGAPSAGDSGGGMVVQMIQPTASAATGNAPSNYAYVRPAGGH
jgi:hypothetical protein